MEIKGTIIKLMPTKRGVSKATGKDWSSRDFVLEVPNESNPQYSEKLVLNVFGEDKVNDKSLVEGNEIIVHFNFAAKEYKETYFNVLSVWKIEPTYGNPQNDNTDAVRKAMQNEEQPHTEQKQSKPQPAPQPSRQDEEDLPF